jgi:hypothetical protein
MAASASALPRSLKTEPGAEESCWVQIQNTGEVVDEFVFEVLGDSAPWAEVDPPKLSLYPGTEGELKLTFRPPRVATTPSGVIPFGLKISSKENPEDAVVEEGALVVAPFTDTAVELTPRTSHGRFAGKHELAFDNRGNVPLDGALAAGDPDDLLRFSFKPPALAAAAGSATFAKVRARPRKRLWRGQPKTHPFTVRVDAPEQPQPLTAEGTMVQTALIPTWAVWALAGAALLVGLWALVLRPSIQSTARDAARKEQVKLRVRVNQQANKLDQQGNDTKGLETAIGGLQQDVAALKKPPHGGGSSGGGGGGKPATAPAVNIAKVVAASAAEGSPTGARLVVSCPPTCTDSLPVPKGKTFALTDIVLENPKGDSGTLTLKRADDVLLVESLENFRELDFHFIAPVVVSGGQALMLDVDCQNGAAAAAATASAEGGTAAATPAPASAPPAPCTDAAYLAGFQAKSKKQG